MKFENNLPKKFFQWIEFELGRTPKKNKTISDSKVNLTFSKVLLGTRSVVKNLSPVSALFAYYNTSIFQLDTKKDVSNIDFFLNDINLLDDFVLNSHLNFKNCFLPIDRPFLAGVFHFDSHPFHETYMEPEFLYLSINSDNLLSTKFSSTLEKPFGFFLTPRFRKKFNKDKISQFKTVDFFNHYYLTRTFLALLMDEERFYITSKKLYKAIVKFLFIVLFVILIIYHVLPILHFLMSKLVWKLFYCDLADLYERTTTFFYHPIDGLKFYGWNMYLTLKLSFIYIHDFVVAIYFLKQPKKQIWYWIINERDKIKKREKFSDLLHRWFW